MTGRELPFVAHCEELKRREDPELDKLIVASLLELFRAQGWQLVLKYMRDIVDDALSGIAKGQQPDFNAGRISAIEQLRVELREQSKTPVDTYDEGLTEE